MSFFLAINSFGFGGSNTHVVMRAPDSDKRLPLDINTVRPDFAKILCYSGRTKEAVQNIFANVKKHSDNYSLQKLLHGQVFLS